jgi:PIN domain nuclease of toxin-antitoxin system
VKYLLDTHVLLWWFLRSDRLKKRVRETLADPGSTVYVSAVSAWEIAIKMRLGKLELPGTPASFLPSRIARAGMTPLPILASHAYGVFDLPDHHADPFDRLLIAQAQAESLTIVTADTAFKEYDVRSLLT